MSPRLSLALSDTGLELPGSEAVAVFHARADADLSALPKDRVVCIQPFFPDHQGLSQQGYACVLDPPVQVDASLICLPRAKAQARATIAAAMAITKGPVIVDGVKTDGIDSVLKAVKARVGINGVVSKAHGKLFWIEGDADVLADWHAQPGTVDAFTTAPGVFSADGIDPASRLLADALPEKLGRRVVDLGAGWGYLAACALARPGIEQLDLVEADHVALECARANVDDPRARFHWDDAVSWKPDGRADAVLMNPPFHTGRSADPGLGRAFIGAAARLLAPSGTLWMVANRHLPYESTLGEYFAQLRDAGGDGRFKVLAASRPSRPRR
ncbi:MAG: class I SAM-dependent methyltransferase [Sedimentitalea sp.]